MVDALFDGLELDVLQSASLYNQARYMAVALVVMQDRQKQYGADSWRMIGWKGHLLRMWDKVVRLMNGHWWGTAVADEKPIDNAVDMINHAIFFARAYAQGLETGELPK
jgi:hypothetical protein